jgi:ubiquitin-protein ligase
MSGMAGGYRSGSVCLDVINQTWSPMFGEFVKLLLKVLQFFPRALGDIRFANSFQVQHKYLN